MSEVRICRGEGQVPASELLKHWAWQQSSSVSSVSMHASSNLHMTLTCEKRVSSGAYFRDSTLGCSSALLVVLVGLDQMPGS